MSEPLLVVIVPVKPLALGKSRLRGLPDEQRRRLAGAFARDTVRAASAAGAVHAVLVVTDDFRFAAEVEAEGCAVIPDGVAEDLNASLRQAAAEVVRRWPGATPVVLCADLPALRAADLDAALASLPAGPAFVRDARGAGTTLYAAPAPLFDPAFGSGSAERHLAAGATEIEAAASLRQDVDDVGDLGRALVLGVGPHTAAATGR